MKPECTVERLDNGTEIKSIPMPEGDLRCPVCGNTELQTNVPFVCYLPTSYDCPICGTSCVAEGDRLLYIEGDGCGKDAKADR